MRTLRPAWRPERWSFSEGPEFPGAAGSFERSPEAAHAGQFGGRLTFDFRGGGNYVAAAVQLDKAPPLSAVRLWLNNPAGHGLTVRYTDQTDQTLQKSLWAPGGRWVEVLVPFDEWSGHWGGADDGQIHGPPKTIAILMERGADESGALLFDDVRFVAGEAESGGDDGRHGVPVFGFDEDEHWALHANGDAGASSLSGPRWALDFSQRRVSRSGSHRARCPCWAIRWKSGSGSVATRPGIPVRLMMATHFMTFEKDDRRVCWRRAA